MAEVVLLENIEKRFRTAWVLRGVNLTVDAGEGALIIGSNGSGKTTLLRIIAGLLKPTRGVVRVFGSSPYEPNVRRYIGYVAHNSLLYPELTVRENLLYYAKLYGVRGYNPEKDEVVEELGLKKFLDRRVEELSFGWRKRADIARALLHKPRLLLIDEPFTGLDDEASRTLSRLLEGLTEKGVSVVATSPSETVLKFLNGFRVYKLVDGKLVVV